MSHCFTSMPVIDPTLLRSYRWTDRYPALMVEIDVDTMIMLAQLIPIDGVAVEIGSMLGGSAKIICEHAPQMKNLYCIDVGWKLDIPCVDYSSLDSILHTFGLDRSKSCRRLASEILAPHHDKVRLMDSQSPYELSWWTEQVDFVFEDSSHENPQLRDNLDFWWSHLKSGGIMAGHDFIPAWQDVYSEITAFTTQHGVDLKVNGTIWWCIKP